MAGGTKKEVAVENMLVEYLCKQPLVDDFRGYNLILIKELRMLAGGKNARADVMVLVEGGEDGGRFREVRPSKEPEEWERLQEAAKDVSSGVFLMIIELKNQGANIEEAKTQAEGYAIMAWRQRAALLIWPNPLAPPPKRHHRPNA